MFDLKDSGAYLSIDASPFPVTSKSLKKEISRAMASPYMISESSDMDMFSEAQSTRLGLLLWLGCHFWRTGATGRVLSSAQSKGYNWKGVGRVDCCRLWNIRG